MQKNKITENILVITIGFLLLYILFKKDLFIYISLAVGLSGILIKPLAGIISLGWVKLGEALGYVSSKIILTLVFFLVLLPISLLYRFFKKDKLTLKKRAQTYWHERNYLFSAKDIEHIW